MPPANPPPSPESADRKVLIFVGSIVGLIGILVFIWIWAANATPTVPSSPAPKLPTKNAYNTYIAAARSLVRDKDIGDAISHPPRKPLTLAQKEDLVRANGKALQAVRQGLRLPYHEPPQERSAETSFPHSSQFRTLARLLVLDGNIQRDRGRAGEAASRYLDAVQLGQQVPRGGPLITRLVGIACQAIGRRPFWDLHDTLDAATAKAAARRLEAIAARKVPYAETLEEEKYWGQALMLETFDDPTKMASGGTASGDEDAAPTPAAMQIVYLLHSKRQILRSYTEYMDRLIAESREPFAAHPNLPPLPSDPLNQMVLPIFRDIRLKDTENDTQNALLRAALALRAYRVEHGRYPDRLDALAPAYLSRTPRDPYALSGPLRYRRTGDKYVLYSLGPDGRDDNGKPIDNPAETGAKRWYATFESRGDMVAGVNIF